MNLGRVDRIATVVACAVAHELDLALAERRNNQLNDLEIGLFVVAADIINLADAAVANDKVNCAAVVLHVQPVADILAIAVDRQRLIVQHVRDHQRNQLFREMIRAVVVRAARDRHRHAERAVVRLHEQVSTCLARRVRAGGVNRCFLGEKQVGTVKRQVAVHLVG